MKQIEVHILFKAKYAVESRSWGAFANQALNSTPPVLKEFWAIGTCFMEVVAHFQSQGVSVAPSVLKVSGGIMLAGLASNMATIIIKKATTAADQLIDPLAN
jgi:hypothetical protein